MDTEEIKRIAARNPKVDLDLLKRAQKSMERVFVQPAVYDIEPAFGQRRAARARKEPHRVAASSEG